MVVSLSLWVANCSKLCLKVLCVLLCILDLTANRMVAFPPALLKLPPAPQ